MQKTQDLRTEDTAHEGDVVSQSKENTSSSLEGLCEHILG